MTLQPEVHVVNVENGTEEPPSRVPEVSLAELILIVTDQLGGDPVEIIRDAIWLLKSRSDGDAGTRIISEAIWRGFDNEIPSDAQLVELEQTVELMRD